MTLLIYTAATSGPAIVLDEGPDIGSTSLSLSAGTLSWWHAGVERTAPLPGEPGGPRGTPQSG
jgi:hypothetical protein